MIRRDPVLISTVTAMPGARSTSLSSISICVRASATARREQQLLIVRLAGFFLLVAPLSGLVLAR